MEEILASIRRIIADDQQAKPAPAAAPPEPTIDEDDVLDLAHGAKATATKAAATRRFSSSSKL